MPAPVTTRSDADLTLAGTARVGEHFTSSGKRVDRVYFLASGPFVYRGERFNPLFFTDGALLRNGLLLDWRGRANGVAARETYLQQPIVITVTMNDRGYWDIIDLKITGPCGFAPDVPLHQVHLIPLSTSMPFPPAVVAQLQENAREPRRWPMFQDRHGPWVTPTGRPEDLVLVSSPTCQAT